MRPAHQDRDRMNISLPCCLAPALGLALAISLAACSSHPHPPRPTFSPNGEPLVPPQWPGKCEDALGVWFDRVAKSGDTMTLAEMQADADRQYALMDLRHNGKVTAEELSTYRLRQMGGHYISVSTPGTKSIAEQQAQGDERPMDPDLGPVGRTPEQRKRRRDEDDDEHRQMDAFNALISDQPDPVMTADTDLNGSVSPEEFRTLVAQNFAELDEAHKGFVTKSQVQTLCERYRE